MGKPGHWNNLGLARMTGGHQQGGHGISLGAGEGVCFSGSGDRDKEEGDSSGVHKGKARAVQIWIQISGTTLTCCVTVGNSSTSLSLVPHVMESLWRP